MARLHQVDYSDVDITGGFWEKRQETNFNVTLPAVRDRFVETGRFAANMLNWREGMPNKPYLYFVGDVEKWIEAAAYVLKKNDDPKLEQWIDNYIDDFSKAVDQRTGYYHPYISTLCPGSRWADRNYHELYLAGHMFEAAVAYAAATGKKTLLTMACKFADYIEEVFVREHSAAFDTGGHEEIELALIKLGHYTGERRYLDLARYFVDKRGTGDKDRPLFDDALPGYDQSHLPAREQSDARGHAVRAGYFYAGMADVAMAYDDRELSAACERIFENIALRRMYVTGGLGSTYRCEGFTIDYDLPNLYAYSETCAGIGFMFFAHRMTRLTGESKYADALERVLYNAFLSSVSLDGLEFFYENPLEISPKLLHKDDDFNKVPAKMPQPQRSKVFSTSCCPPNICRFLASVGGYLYMTSEDTLYVNHFMHSAGRIALRARSLDVEQITDYPVGGEVRLKVGRGKGLKLAVRIPAWCAAPRMDGDCMERKNGYAFFEIDSDDYTLTLHFPMKPRIIEANPLVAEDTGRVAIARGPVIYCAEAVDNGENMADIRIDSRKEIKEVWSGEYMTCVLDVPATRRDTGSAEWLYREMRPSRSAITLRAIPYFAFANRGLSEMRVWFLGDS